MGHVLRTRAHKVLQQMQRAKPYDKKRDFWHHTQAQCQFVSGVMGETRGALWGEMMTPHSGDISSCAEKPHGEVEVLTLPCMLLSTSSTLRCSMPRTA